eukprot:COSAG01_NODE_1306_length_10805_cov_29.835700_2_plen_133_part_00
MAQGFVPRGMLPGQGPFVPGSLAPQPAPGAMAGGMRHTASGGGGGAETAEQRRAKKRKQQEEHNKAYADALQKAAVYVNSIKTHFSDRAEYFRHFLGAPTFLVLCGCPARPRPGSGGVEVSLSVVLVACGKF